MSLQHSFQVSAAILRSSGAIMLTIAAAAMVWLSFNHETQAAISFGKIFVVNTAYDASAGADDSFPGDGVCETGNANGFCTLRAALDEIIARNNGVDGISFNIPTTDPGYGNGVWTIALASALPDISVPVSISGPGAVKLVIDAGGVRTTSRVFNVTTAGTVSFSGLTLTGGLLLPGHYGAGIQNSVNGGTINVTNCTLTNNQALGNGQSYGIGGAIYNAGTANITKCVFRLNTAGNSGIVGFGGAIWNNGPLHVVNSTFERNESSHSGGAIWNEGGGTATISSSTFYGNGAIRGGGIGSYGGTVSVTNCTFYANIAYGFGGEGIGGAIANINKSVLNLTNSTVTGNFSNYRGSGVYQDAVLGAVANVKSTIIALNTLGISGSVAAPDVYGAFKSAGFNLIGRRDGSTGFSAATDKKGTVASPLDPKLDPKGLRSNGGPTQTIALLTGSPAIDAGTSIGLTGTLTTDERGSPRTFDNTSVANASGGDGSDTGAYERETQ